MISQRLRRRLIRHHFPIAIIASVGGALLYATRPYPDVLTRLSFATAYPALILLALTLLIGPWRLLMRRPMAKSVDIRRDFGIWAGIFGFLHAAVGQFVHLRGRPWLYYIYENWQLKHTQPVRFDLFGLANYSGLFATLILLALLATSNDASLRALKPSGWKQLQRWNYVGFALTGIHTFAYQVGIKSINAPYVVTAMLATTLTVIVQFVGYRRRRTAVA